MKSQSFKSFDLISNLSFLLAYKVDFDTNGLHVGVALWLLHLFRKRPAAAALNECIALNARSHRRQKEGTITWYCDAVINLVEIYARDNIIVVADADTMQFSPQSNQPPTEYVEAL